MKQKTEVTELVVATSFLHSNRSWPRGMRVRSDDPVAIAMPERFAPAPVRDGTVVCVVSRVTPTGVLLPGQVFATSDPRVLASPDAFVPGPVQKMLLPALAAAVAYNSPGPTEARRRNSEETIAKRRAERERRAAALDHQADELEQRAAALRAQGAAAAA